MDNNEYCLAYECPLQEVPEELLQICDQLGECCENCQRRC